MAGEPEGFEQAVLNMIAAQMDGMISGITAHMGTPPGSKRYTREEERREWTHTPYPDPQERMNKALEMHMAGATGEEITDAIYPNLRRLITTSRPSVPEQIAFARQMRAQVGWPEQVPSLDGFGTGLVADQMAVVPSPIPPPMPAAPPIAEPAPAMPVQQAPPSAPPTVLPGLSSMMGG